MNKIKYFISYYYNVVKYYIKDKFEELSDFLSFWWIMISIYLRSFIIKFMYKFNKNIPVVWIKIETKRGMFLFRSIKLYDESKNYYYCHTIDEERMVLDDKGKAFPLEDFAFKCAVKGYWKDINGISRYIMEV